MKQQVFNRSETLRRLKSRISATASILSKTITTGTNGVSVEYIRVQESQLLIKERVIKTILESL